MTAKPKPIFVRYSAKDFLDGVQILTALEELAYRRICDLIYVNGGALADDDGLAWATKTGAEWPAVRNALIAKKKMRVVRGKVVVKRCQIELDRVETYRKSQKKRSKMAVLARKKAPKKRVLPNAGKPNENKSLQPMGAIHDIPSGAPADRPSGSPNQILDKETPKSPNTKTAPSGPPSGQDLQSEVAGRVMDMLTEADARWATRHGGMVRQWIADGFDPETHIYPVIRQAIQRGQAGEISTLGYFTPAIRRLAASREAPGPDPDAGTPRVLALELSKTRGDEPFQDRLAAAWGDTAAADRIGEQYLSDHSARTHGQAQEA